MRAVRMSRRKAPVWGFFDGLLLCPSRKSGSFTIPDGVTTIGEKSFYYCDGITDITIPESVVNIGNSAFAECDGIKSVKIPSKVKAIGEYAFNSCTNLTDITIPKSVKKISYDAFTRSENLTDVTYKGKTYSYANISELYAAING